MHMAYMTIDEVFTAYPLTWVVLDQPRTDDRQVVVGGEFICSVDDRIRAQEMAIEKQLQRCVIVRTQESYRKGEPTRDYAISPITSYTEIAEVMASKDS
jgi:hypothetical protein